MTDSSGSTGGVGGVGGVDGAGASSATSDAAAEASAVSSMAQGMVDGATGPAGVDVDALGQAVAAAQATAPTAELAASLQAEVEAQLSPVQVGQLQAAIDQASLSVPSTIEALTASPLANIETPAGLFNAQGQPIDACGNVQPSLSVDRSVPANQTDLAKTIETIDRITGGPISGPAYAAAYVAGADAKTLDTIHAVGKTIDAALGVQSKAATARPSTAPAMTPADWNYTQR